MATRSIPVYQKDSAVHNLVTKIVSCLPIHSLAENDQSFFKGAGESDHVVSTEDTIFHPQGGGQPSDIGEMNQNNEISFSVKYARKLPDNQIYHLGSFANPQKLFNGGDVVSQNINSATRNYHSRYHTAGHILGLAVKQLKDIVGVVSELKANHAPGMAFVEFQGLIAGEHKAAIQEKASGLIVGNLEVKVDWWDIETAKARGIAVPEGSAPEDGKIRVVDVVGVGAYACGGTHLPETRDIGGIVVRKISRQKGVTKISYDITDV
ncbi:unnamed protein product [Penicillium olsonii]|nr:unnamed protein product [Penicillium olsonii]CAG7933470.1 unnamed protein product [Penicillium olsonii]